MEYVRYERVYGANEIHEDFDSVYSPIEQDRDIDMMCIKVSKNEKEYILAEEDGCVVRHIFSGKEIDRLKNEDLIIEGRICPEDLKALKNAKRKVENTPSLDAEDLDKMMQGISKIFNEIQEEKRNGKRS